ncbi:hypothetical protein [Streptomyces fructofermentans]|nr:hypothetical protein [Streptomyces fructofermentans]
MHDRTMLVEVVNIAKLPGGPLLARVRTRIGDTSVRWCGDPAAEPGEYHVEWTVDDDITWGRNAGPATAHGHGIRRSGHRSVLRGRLRLEEDGVGLLDLHDVTVLLDFAEPLPDGVDGTWVEILVRCDRIALYPYEL